MEIGECLRAARLAKKMTLRELEEITTLSYSYLAKIERGEKKPTEENIERIANQLDIDKIPLLKLAGFYHLEDLPNEEKLAIRFNVLERDDFKCVACGERPPSVKIDATMLIPDDKGGKWVEGNLISLCNSCRIGRNAYIEKHGFENEVLFRRYRLRGLFY
jgi:transcriptional regulator with XRE-family HTH domain